jgi:shikimate dehydrogenase
MSPRPDWPAGDATVCISVSARPGRFGSAVHTAGYRALALNYVYLARPATNIAAVIAAVRTLGIRGCSVSMPFKMEVIRHLDALDPLAIEVGAVNTVVNDGGTLTGFNTDVAGVVGALQTVNRPLASALVLGAGGMSRAVVTALARLGVKELTLSARDRSRAEQAAGDRVTRIVDWHERERVDADLLINATSAGMAPDTSDTPMPASALNRFAVVADVIASPPETALIAAARHSGRLTVGGVLVAFHQALVQFRHYTGMEPPVREMHSAAEQLAGVRM